MPQEFSRFARLFAAVAGFTVLAACGGGGGSLGGGDSGGGSNPAPAVSLSASANSIAAGQTVTLNWTSNNATSCTASGGWSGSRGVSGSEASGAIAATTTFTLTCSGAGGSNAASTTVTVVGPPTVTFNAAQTALTENYSTTLSWTAANATGCTASNSGGAPFTGTKSASGTDTTGPVSGTTTYTLTCTGLGGDSAPQSVSVTATPPPVNQVVLFGQVTFDRLPFSSAARQGLNASQPIESPAREVQVVVSGGASATTTTDAGGYYAVTVPAAASVAVSVRAQMQKTGSLPNWDFRILNNTNSDAIYVLNGSGSSVPIANVSRDLHAPSGWGGNSYTGQRAAAPFAILDTVYQAKQLILGAAPNTNFPALNLYWSGSNRAATPLCPDQGNIGTSFYFSDPSGTVPDECSTSAPLPSGIYILGDFANGNGDTDEFDAHVVAHEFGHYFEDRFSRSDSIGGEHTLGDLLDLRVAFGEGWGNAFAAMSLADPRYRDSSQGISQDFGFNLEEDSSNNEGWFSESSVGEFLWDVFDNNTPPEARDNVALGFGPIHAVMTGAQVNTDALTSIFSFAAALRAANSGVSGDINTLLRQEGIDGTDAFGAGETNNGDDTRALPVYDTITLNTPKNGVCSSSVGGNTDTNKLGNHRFLRFENNASRLVTITLQGAAPTAGTVAATDPDIYVYRRGVVTLAGFSAEPGRETILQRQLAAGTYVFDVFDFDVDGADRVPRCMNVTISGN